MYNRKSFLVRGEITLGVIVIVAAITVVGAFLFKNHSSSSIDRNKTPIAQVEKIEDKKKEETDKVDSRVSIEKNTQLTNAQAAVHGTTEAIDQANKKLAAGGDPSRELSTAKDINDIAVTAIDEYVGKPVDPKLMKWFIDSIDRKNSEILREREIGEKMLSEKRNELIASSVREKELIAQREKIISAYDKKLEVAEKARDEWSLQNAAKAKALDNIYFWIYVVVGLYILSMILPLLAKVLPGLAPIATGISAIMAPSVLYGKSQAEKLAADMVALQNHTKEYIARIDESKIEDYKESVKKWWGSDAGGQNAVEEIKNKLRI